MARADSYPALTGAQVNDADLINVWDVSANALKTITHDEYKVSLRGTFLLVVTHGATASTARPAGAAAVMWIGSVEPSNAEDHDFWFDTSS